MEDYAKFHHDGGVHIEDEVTQEISNDSSNDPNHISLQDVLFLIEKPEEGAEVSEYLMKHKSFILEHKVKRVNKYINEIRSFWADATPGEMVVAFDESNGDIDELTMNLIKPGFKENVKEIVKKRLSHDYSPTKPAKTKSSDSESPPEPEEYDESDDVNDKDYYRRDDIQRNYQKRHTRAPSLPHTDEIPPCPESISPDEWQSWSDARRTSYLRGMDYPNSYFYRHLPPGEVQKNGSWSPEEKAAFLKRLDEFRGNSTTMNGDWGLFSRTLPGRVGYQCANFYRKLIENGEVYDSNYVKGEEGKIHHKSRIHDGKVIVKVSHPPTNEHDDVQPSPPKPKKPKSHKIVDPEDIRSLKLVFNGFRDDKQPTVVTKFVPVVPVSVKHHSHEPSDESHTASRSSSNPQISRYEQWALQNPLPDMLDNITGEKIRVPAMSPDGYVLDYNTWLSSLKTNKENPFTRAPVTKRQLVILTKENFDEYKDKILNLNTQETI